MKITEPLARLMSFSASVLFLSGCHAQADAQKQTAFTSSVSSVSAMQDAGNPFRKLRLVDEINCGASTEAYEFSEMPPGISKVEIVLGKASRILPARGDAKYFAYRIGKGKGLKAGAAYVLAVEFPEDKPRSMFIVNRGAEMVRGVRTGQALGDVLYTHTNNNNESLKIPLSGKYNTWKALFFMHDRLHELGLETQNAGGAGKQRVGRPENGFWVAITQSRGDNDPLSAGAAVSRIRLYEVDDVTQLNMPLRLPPAGLPQRHLFWREEMADGVIMDKPEERGVINSADWFEYKARLMQFLGMNTYSKDLLEFGHNQGWDSGPGNDWFNASSQPELWENILDRMAKYGFNILPYYEYTGAVGKKGIGNEKRAKPLSGAAAYTHIHWTEGRNVDITDPDTLTDAKKVLDATIVRYKAKVKFVGAWFRPRPSQMAIGFADATLARFATEVNNGQSITREQLKSDKALLDRYYRWWFVKRRDFLVALRDHLRSNGIAGAEILFTSDASEPGRSLNGPHAIVTDDVDTVDELLQLPAYKGKTRAVSYDEVVRGNKHFEALTSPRGTWGEWEWQHSDPQSDPQNYRDSEGALLTYSFNRAYSVSSPTGLDAFRTRSGLAAVMHYPLNEHSMEKSLGYIASDVEYAGPYIMLSEARAMAYGDPRYIGYLAASSFNRGFPEYVRAFNAAFLALPALPSQVLSNASSDPSVVVRSIKTPRNGTYLALVNVGLQSKNVFITLPTSGKVVDAATGKALSVTNGKLQLSFYPCEMKSVQIQ